MKNVIIAALIIAGCYLGYLWLAERSERVAAEKRIQTPAAGVPLDMQEVSRKVDSAGLEHVIYKEAEPIERLIELKVEDKAKVDSLMGVVGIKERQLQGVTNIAAQVQQENVQLKRFIDNISRDTTYVYRDKYLDLSYTQRNDSIGALRFAYDLELNTMQYWRKKWALGAKQSFLEVWSSDPRVKIRGVERLTIRQAQPQYGMRVQAAGAWNPETGALGYGGGLRFDIGRWSVKGLYLYYPELGEWRPQVQGNFDIIRF